MPAKSEKQLKLIYAIRNKYKSKAKSPKKWKWVWGEEWGHMESRILTFKQFEAISNFTTIPMEELETVEDILMELVDKWSLGLETHNGYNGYVSVKGMSMGGSPIIDISIQINIFKIIGDYEFEADLKRVKFRLEKFGFNFIRNSPPYRIVDPSSFETYIIYSFSLLPR